MNRTALSGHAADAGYRPDTRAPGAGFGRVLFRWRERMWQRRELAAMSGRDLAELGVLPALAAYEAGRWPWQKISPAWRESYAAGCEIRQEK
jgi:uncharacterized protein YjiS (DUF1127 family)